MWQLSWVFPSILSAGYAQKNRRLPFFFAFKQKNFASHGVSLTSENINQTTEKQMSYISFSAFSDTKAHYDLLDGLRGVAALMVIWYHIFEGYAFAGGGIIETFNHGYLAVDFFFILSGFVIGYAYDDRWGRSLTMKSFFKRRLIRLHPMVIMGAVLGAITFCIQGCIQWDGTHIALSMIMLSLLCSIFFIPAMPGAGYEVRGNGEMFPLNGPCWSLFFEYIGKHPLCLVHPTIVKQSTDRTDNIAGNSIGIIRHLRCLRIWQYGSRLDTGRNKLYRRIIEDAFPLLHGYAFIAQLQAH